MDFYMVLPSNASHDVYPQNKTSNFKVQLSQHLQLRGDWQLAVLEVHYPHTFLQVRTGENWIKVTKPLTDDSVIVSDSRTHPRHTQYNLSEEKYHVRPGVYATPESLVNAIRDTMRPLLCSPDTGEQQDDAIGITSDGRVEFKKFCYSPHATYDFAPSLALQLGLLHFGPHFASTEFTGVHRIDMSLGVPSQMYIYMDIIQEQIVGNTRAPLVRTIPVDTNAKFGSMTVYRCEHPIYFDLNTKSFDTIEVHIRTHSGTFMPFLHGTSTLVCHLKQRG